LKSKVQYILQQLLGFDRYLRWFAVFKVYTLRWDSKENDFFTFLSILPKGGTLLDVGANLGLMTHFMSAHSDEVLAIEPLPENLKTLEYMNRRFGWKGVRILPVAVGAESGEAEMVMPEVEKVRKQGLSHVVHDSITEFNAGKRMKVPMKTLDELTQDLKKPVVGIKMDVENFEYFALKGAQQLLKRDKPVVYTELWENENRTKCFGLMKELGYTCYVVQADQLMPFDKEKHQGQNFIFKP
jgi:FkbM family methyltransferase